MFERYNTISEFFLKEKATEKIKKISLLTFLPAALFFIVYLILGNIYVFMIVVFFLIIGGLWFFIVFRRIGFYLTKLEEEFPTLVNLTKSYKNLDFFDLLDNLRGSNLVAYKEILNEVYLRLDSDVNKYLDYLIKKFYSFPYVRLYIVLLKQKLENKCISKQLEFLSETYVPLLYSLKKMESSVGGVKMILNIIPFFFVVIFLISFFSIKKIEIFLNMGNFHSYFLKIGSLFVTLFGLNVLVVPLFTDSRKDSAFIKIIIFLGIMAGVILFLQVF